MTLWRCAPCSDQSEQFVQKLEQVEQSGPARLLIGDRRLVASKEGHLICLKICLGVALRVRDELQHVTCCRTKQKPDRLPVLHRFLDNADKTEIRMSESEMDWRLWVLVTRHSFNVTKVGTQ